MARSFTRSPISLHHSLTLSLSLGSGHEAPASVVDRSFLMYVLSRLESNLGLLGEGAEERDALDAAIGERIPARDICSKLAIGAK